MDKLSYALGLNIGLSFKQSKISKIDYNSFSEGLKAMLENQEPKVSLKDAQSILNDFFASLEATSQEESLANKKAADDFLTANAKKEGVKVLPSGLQYKILVEGNGKKPKLTDKVRVHYHGTLTNGEVFDSSVNRGEPAEFGVNQVIAGWVEALQLMSEGSKWRLYIPSELAYGERGAGSIPPNSALIFDVELLNVL